MTHQQTSIDAYHQEEGSGRLLRKRDIVERAFREHGPGTSAEVLVRAKLDTNRNLMRARVTELEDDGALRVVSEHVCTVTGRRARVLEFVPDGQRVPRVRIEVKVREPAIDELCDFVKDYLDNDEENRRRLRLVDRGHALLAKYRGS